MSSTKQDHDFNTLNNLFPTDQIYDEVKQVIILLQKAEKLTGIKRIKFLEGKLPKELESSAKMKRFVQKYHNFEVEHDEIFYNQ
jgi:hypothetical protein